MVANSDALTTARENLVGARAGLVSEIARLQAGVDQIDSFLSTFGDVPAPVAPSPAATAPAAAPVRRGRPKGSKNKPKAAAAPAASSSKGGKRPRRGAITEAIIKYLDQRAPTAEHADKILDYLDSVGAAPQSSNPKPTLQSTLNRLQAQGQVRNIGKNQWRRVQPTERTAGTTAPAAEAAAPRPRPLRRPARLRLPPRPRRAPPARASRRSSAPAKPPPRRLPASAARPAEPDASGPAPARRIPRRAA